MWDLGLCGLITEWFKVLFHTSGTADLKNSNNLIKPKRFRWRQPYLPVAASNTSSVNNCSRHLCTRYYNNPLWHLNDPKRIIENIEKYGHGHTRRNSGNTSELREIDWKFQNHNSDQFPGNHPNNLLFIETNDNKISVQILCHFRSV